MVRLVPASRTRPFHWTLGLSFLVATGGLSSVSAAAAAAGGASSATTPFVPHYKPDLKYPTLHGLLMWASMGLCMPIGILLIRFSKAAIQRGSSSTTIHTLRKLHIGIQAVAVLLSVAGGAVALAKFGMKFQHTHQRLGLTLLVSTWAMPFLGALRPDRGHPFRPFWYALHWLVGTATVILGVLNIFIGMHVFELISSRSLRTWNILFSIQLSLVGLIYLAQDRWAYLKEQGQPIFSKPTASPLPIVTTRVAPQVSLEAILVPSSQPPLPH